MPFAGLRVMSLESRRAREMEEFIRRLGGEPFVAPSVHERPLDDQTEAIRFLERLEAGEFDMVILMTGVGLEFLRDIIVRQMPIERLAEALRRVTVVARGPKPVSALRAMGVPAQLVIPEPNTWKEIVEAVAARPERNIAIQEYGRPNAELNAALGKLGANVVPVQIYRWELPADLGPLMEASRRLAAVECDVVLFTSSIQLDHLLEVSRSIGLETEVRKSLQESVAVASVGPVMTTSLISAGFPVDIVPNHPKMGSLVKAAAESAAEVLARKRSSQINVR
jgi:uroporphyrinogen-III synthase